MQQIEKLIETKPELAQEMFPNTPIETEAKQITDDNDKRNDEVNNVVIGEMPDLHQGDPAIDRMHERINRLQKDILGPDEDFLGPDEYIDENGNIQVDINWKPEDADEDFVGPDEQLAVVHTNLPEEIYTDPVYDTSDYNFDWNAVIETLPNDLQEELNELPEEDKEEISSLLHWNLNRDLGGSPTYNDTHRNPEVELQRAIGHSMLGRTNIINADRAMKNNGHVGGSDTHKDVPDSSASVASSAPIPPTVNESTGTEIFGSNNSVSSSNGIIGSGAGLLFHKKGMLESVKTMPDLQFTGHTSEPTTTLDAELFKDNLVESLNRILNSALARHREDELEKLGFSHRHKHWSWRDITLDEHDIHTLSDLYSKLTNSSWL